MGQSAPCLPCLHSAVITSAAVDAIHYLHRVDGEVWVSPTQPALALSGGPSSEVQQKVAEGYVIVETNYRVRLQPLVQFTSIPFLSCTLNCSCRYQ
jgi:hypothetical protein